MRFPYIFKKNSNYNLSCELSKQELEELAENSQSFDRDQFAERAKEVLVKHGDKLSHYPYFIWGDSGVLTEFHVGDGGRWIDRLQNSYAFHNIDFVTTAIAGAEIVIGEYLNKLGFSLPFVTKNGEQYYFRLSLPEDRRGYRERIKTIKHQRIDEIAANIFETHQVSESHYPILEWTTDGELSHIQLGQSFGSVTYDGQNYFAENITDPCDCLAALQALTFFLNYVLQDN